MANALRESANSAAIDKQARRWVTMRRIRGGTSAIHYQPMRNGDVK